MGYKLVISERAERHIDNIIHYVVNTLKNTGAAEAILSDIDEAYNRLEYMAEIHGYCNDYYYLGLLNCKIAMEVLYFISPTINYQVGNLSNIPVLLPTENSTKTIINTLVEENISLSKADWDSFETSWDFEGHPLI